jgi:hypothetical protein
MTHVVPFEQRLAHSLTSSVSCLLFILSLQPHVDIYGFQLYRGHSFGAYFNQYYAETSKPLLSVLRLLLAHSKEAARESFS